MFQRDWIDQILLCCYPRLCIGFTKTQYYAVVIYYNSNGKYSKAKNHACERHEITQISLVNHQQF